LNCRITLPGLQRIRVCIAHYHRRLSRFLKLQTKSTSLTTVHGYCPLSTLPPQQAASLRHCYFQCKLSFHVQLHNLYNKQKHGRQIKKPYHQLKKKKEKKRKKKEEKKERNTTKRYESLWLNICDK